MLGVKRPVPGADPHDYAITIVNPKQLLSTLIHIVVSLLFIEYYIL